MLGRRQVAVFRTRSGDVFATQSHCPHRQGPLADGLVGTGTVVCPLHEWQFDLSTGKSLNGTCNIEVYPVAQDESGILTVELPSEDN